MGSDGAFANFRLAGATKKNGTLLGGPGVVRVGLPPQTPFRRNLGPFRKDNEHSGVTFLPSHDLGGKTPYKAGRSGDAMWGVWPMAILDRLVQNAYRIQRRGDPRHKNHDKRVCGTSRIRALIQPRAPLSSQEASLGLYRIRIPTRSAAGGEGRMARLG